jgi:hypothetical protein
MRRIIKYILVLVLLYVGVALSCRGLHKLTRIAGKISKIKIEPYYPKHKDSVHYVITFGINNFNNRLAVYIGDEKMVANSRLIPLLDTSKVYTLFVDVSEPVYNGMIVGVRKIVLDGRTIYKSSRLFTFLGGVSAFVFAIFLLFYKNKKELLKNIDPI